VNFVDEAVIHVQAGRGGNGCVAFRREKFVPRGGPAGGDGGPGGSLFLEGDSQLNTLHNQRFNPHYKAERGQHGEGSNRTGRGGKDRVVRVPLGTEVRDADSGEFVTEILEADEPVLIVQGGRGGRGNARFKTSTNQAPRRADPGEEGQGRSLKLELKLLADVGVVGLPNAGKSTLISVVSAARPKIADYPFTTLVPQLGVVSLGIDSDPFVIADLPGLIAGASDGAGLGHQFLRHVERCRVLLHLVDLSVEGSAVEEVEAIERELRSFNADLLRRPRLMVGTKLDSAISERQEELAAAAAARKLEYSEISSVARQGTDPLMSRVQRLLAEVDS